MKCNVLLVALAALTGLATVGQAQLVFGPALSGQIRFADTPLGQTSAIDFTATDRGNGPWTVRIVINHQSFSAVPNQFQVPAGGIAQFQLRFAPQAAGQVSTMLSGSYSNDELIARLSATLIGTGVENNQPELAIDPDSIELAIWVDALGAIWGETVATLNVTNVGRGELLVNDFVDIPRWLDIAPRNFRVQAGQSVPVDFEVAQEQWEIMAPDTYYARVTLRTNAGNRVIPVMFDRGFIPYYLVTLPDNPPEAFHALMVIDATIEDEELSVWDEVGVFTPRDRLAGSGYLSADGWPIAILAWGEGDGFAGFRNNEEFTFRIWDYSAGRDFPAEAVWAEGPEQFQDDGVSALALMGWDPEAILNVPLVRGWNMLSIPLDFDQRYIVNDRPDVIRIWADVVQRNRLGIIKDERGRFYAPRLGFCNIPFWNNLEGYQARLEAADTLVVFGNRLPADTQIDLTMNWNIVAYLPNRQLTMSVAFANLAQQGVDFILIVKNGRGQFWVPRLGFGGNTLINPLEGLQIKVSRDCSFHYPADQLAPRTLRLAPCASHLAPRTDELRHFNEPLNTGSNMSVLIMQIDGIDVVVGAELACFTPTNCLAGVWLLEGPAPWGGPVWGDDDETEEIDGFQHGEPLRFVYWDPARDWELDVTPHLLEPGELRYATDDFIVIGLTVGIEAGNGQIPLDYNLAPVFPNPFNAQASVKFTLPVSADVRVDLVDLNGRSLKTLTSDVQPAGLHRLQFNADGLSNGLYLIVLRTGERQFVQRVVLMK